MHSYCKIWNVGHRAVADIWKGFVYIEEKIDGSQFSFGVKGGELKIHTHHSDISEVGSVPSMFKDAADYVRKLYDASKLHPEWIYRGEVVAKPKHNVLAYDRVPKHNIIIFDIDKGIEDYLSYSDKAAEAAALDLETVPCHFYGSVDSPETIKTLLDRPSILGGKCIEGLVIKAYGRFDPDTGKTLMAKYVSEKFKEVKGDPEANPFSRRDDFISSLAERYRTEARWEKAIAHLREQGVDVTSVKAIGPLMQEIKRDVEEECRDEIKERLYKKFGESIIHMSAKGFPQWFKNKLMEDSFEPSETSIRDSGAEPLSAEPASPQEPG